jgi:hypothetical protein
VHTVFRSLLFPTGLPVAWRSWLLIGLAMAFFAGAVLSQWHYTPMWDSWIYANCVTEAAAHPSQFWRYGCVQHLSHGYVFLLAAVQRLGLSGQPGVLCVNTLLGIGAILALYSSARSVLPGPRYRVDCALLTSGWAAFPVFLASAVFVNIDYGVLVFGLMTLACLLRGRLYSAALAGLGLVLSKETGSLVYLAMVAPYLVVMVGRGPGAPAAKAIRLVRSWPLALPALAVVAYFRWLRGASLSLWGHQPLGAVVDQLTTLRLFTRDTAAAAAGIFVLSFFWIPSAVLAAGAVRRAAAFCVGQPRSAVAGEDPRRLRVVLWTAGLATFLLTRPQTSVSVRYFAVLYPLLLLAFLPALIRFRWGPLPRRFVLGCLAGLFAVSSFRSVDPVSRRVYGVFSFGRHPMFSMTSINRECCGHGIDQLVYNLEFTRIAEVLDAAVVGLAPTPERPIVVPDGTDWYLMLDMEPRTFRRTMAGAGAIRVPELELSSLVAHSTRPRELSFLALPTVDSRPALQWLAASYWITDVVTFGSDGYVVEAYRMRRSR